MEGGWEFFYSLRVETTLKLIEEPLADTARYDSLNAQGVPHA